MSCVKLLGVEETVSDGVVLRVAGADLMDGTPIYDIKPYLPYTDAHPEAKGSFGEAHKEDRIAVLFPEEELKKLPEEVQNKVKEVLEQDPRAAYQKNSDYIYGMSFAGYDIRFTVEENVLIVKEVVSLECDSYQKVKS